MLEHCRTSGRVVRFLGSGEVCSDYMGILAREDRAADVAHKWIDKQSGENRDSADAPTPNPSPEDGGGDFGKVP